MRNEYGDQFKPIRAKRGIPRFLPLALGLWLLAGVTRFWIAPQMTKLPADYTEETSYAARGRFRDTSDGAWEKFDLVVRRVDQTLVASSDHAIVQGDINWTTNAGEVTYESAGIYGVDPRTRTNLPGYGNVQRTGQFLFPPHVRRATYRLWDPFYSGARAAIFSHAATLEGLPVYVFNCHVRGLDETHGYTFLRDVPERYHAYSTATGKVWVEPVSGRVVDFEDAGKSYFGVAATGKPVSDFHFWSARYTPQTKWAQIRRARSARLRLLILENWLPSTLLLAGLGTLTLGLRLRETHRSAPPFPPSTGGPPSPPI
ncbi:MAG: DUF3068 domain-containing protein [Armatimonadetes bacterium]|nr:DUF3068 domain-containing protein [Armatimonadota bacterium]